MSTPRCCARCSTVRALYTPSATWPRESTACASVMPVASSWPTRRLRLRSPVAVSTRSPRPLRPMKVSVRAPRAVPRRVISARPRVMRAARALRPSCKPSHRPVATASTFLTAPPTSTPTRSSLAYTRNVGLWKALTRASRTCAWPLAATSAVGWPLATSWAKLGPLRAPASKSGATWACTSCGISPWPAVADASKPLHNQTTGTRVPANACKVGRNAAVGVETMIRSAPAAKPEADREPDGQVRTCNASGKAWPGKYRRLQRLACMAWAWAASRAHSSTRCPAGWRAAPMASAVPQAPAPRKTIFIAGNVYPSSAESRSPFQNYCIAPAAWACCCSYMAWKLISVR